MIARNSVKAGALRLMAMHARSPAAMVLVALLVAIQGAPPDAPETDVVLEGDVEVLVEDSERSSRVLYFLLPEDGRRIALRFTEEPPELATGTRVRVHGRWARNGALDVISLEVLSKPRAAAAGDFRTERDGYFRTEKPCSDSVE
jgi:hypothetical protein